jgi:hypothetical protein
VANQDINPQQNQSQKLGNQGTQSQQPKAPAQSPDQQEPTRVERKEEQDKKSDTGFNQQ